MKVAFITGGATGIGRATIQKFVQESIRVGFLDYNEQKGSELQSQYDESQVLFTPGNVTKIADIKKSVERTVKHFGKLDIVFANAGIHWSNSILDITEEEWDLVINTNLKGAVFTLRESIPHLIQNGGGAVILMGSDQCFIGKRQSLAYGAGKGAIGQITKSLALDLAEKNIRVNAVCPGTIKTPLADAAIQRWADRDFDGDVERAWLMEVKEFPLRRVGQPEELAELVYFLASDSASFMTGSLVSIDGGITAG